jgi:hypothetical protein
MEEPAMAARDGGDPETGMPAAPPGPSVQVQADGVRVDDLTIDRRVVIDYLQGIARDKQVIALVHALEVGVTELLARRERFKH